MTQDVYHARFNPYGDGRLTTCGTGHIRFWRMARTFTGLKLQGDIGKFGKFDLSDVEAFAELPDGKVCVCLRLCLRVRVCTREWSLRRCVGYWASGSQRCCWCGRL